MSISRRGFLQGTGGALIASLAVAEGTTQREGLHQILPARSVAPTNQKWVMVIDLAKCDGCGDCTKACNAMHFVPPDAGMDPGVRSAGQSASRPLLHGPALHALRQPSLRARMPGGRHVQAHRRAGDDGSGPLHRLPELHRAMPLRSARIQLERTSPHARRTRPSLFAGRGTGPTAKAWSRSATSARKCCARENCTACAENCAMGAVYVGDEYEDAVTNSKGETIQFSKVTKEGAGFRLLEELGTYPRVYYLPPAQSQICRARRSEVLGESSHDLRP